MLALSFKYKSFNVTEIYSSVQSLLLTKNREEVKNSGYACHLLSMLGNCVYYDMGLVMLHGLSIMHLIFFLYTSQCLYYKMMCFISWWDVSKEQKHLLCPKRYAQCVMMYFSKTANTFIKKLNTIKH